MAGFVFQLTGRRAVHESRCAKKSRLYHRAAASRKVSHALLSTFTFMLLYILCTMVTYASFLFHDLPNFGSEYFLKLIEILKFKF